MGLLLDAVHVGRGDGRQQFFHGGPGGGGAPALEALGVCHGGRRGLVELDVAEHAVEAARYDIAGVAELEYLDDALREGAPVVCLGFDGGTDCDHVVLFDVLEFGVVAVGVVAQELAVPVGNRDATPQRWASERVEDGVRGVTCFDFGEPVEVDSGDERVDRGDVGHDGRHYLVVGSGGIVPLVTNSG